MSFLFIPDDGYMKDQTNGIRGSLDEKINTKDLQNAMNSLKGANVRSLSMPRASFMGIDLNLQAFWDTINENIDFIHLFIRAIMYALLIRYNINNVYRLIRGSDMESGGGD